MGRISKIEKYKLEKIVADALAGGKSTRQIAEICSRKAKVPVSHVAISEYIKSLGTEKQKEEVVKRDANRVTRLVDFDFDIIQLIYRTTATMLERFEFVDRLPHMFEERINQLAAELQREGEDNPDYLHQWKIGFVDDLRRNVQSITSLNRELRENSKFMADLREKAFEFKLWKEFTDLFIDAFRQRAPDACDQVLQDIAMNPRMQRIIEMQMKGETA